MRITICTVDGAGAFNGINAWLQRFVPALRAHGHEVAVLAFPWSPPKTCRTLATLGQNGVSITTVYPQRYTESAARACLRHSNEFRPDVFVANMCIPALHASAELSRRGIRTISVLHNDDAEYRAKAAFHADATVAISNGLRSLLPPESDRPVRCIPYGIEPFARTATAPDPGKPFRIVYHGRIAQTQKRILELANALVAASKLHPNLEADIYGSGPKEDALKNQLAADDAGGRVRFAGAASAAEIRQLLPNYHAAVLLSDYEGLGLAILEAMAAGLVPVCLRTRSGLPDLITHGCNGLFVDDRSEDFITTVQKLAADPARWRELSDKAIRTTSTRFDPDVCLQSWEQLFTDLRAGPSKTSFPSSRAALEFGPVNPALASEDIRHPGLVRAWWRWFRFGPARARLPW